MQAHCLILLPPACVEQATMPPQKVHPSLTRVWGWWFSRVVPGPFVVAPAVGEAVPTREAPRSSCGGPGQGVPSGQGVRRQT